MLSRWGPVNLRCRAGLVLPPPQSIRRPENTQHPLSTRPQPPNPPRQPPPLPHHDSELEARSPGKKKHLKLIKIHVLRSSGMKGERSMEASRASCQRVGCQRGVRAAPGWGATEGELSTGEVEERVNSEYMDQILHQ